MSAKHISKDMSLDMQLNYFIPGHLEKLLRREVSSLLQLFYCSVRTWVIIMCYNVVAIALRHLADQRTILKRVHNRGPCH